MLIPRGDRSIGPSVAKTSATAAQRSAAGSDAGYGAPGIVAGGASGGGTASATAASAAPDHEVKKDVIQNGGSSWLDDSDDEDGGGVTQVVGGGAGVAEPPFASGPSSKTSMISAPASKGTLHSTQQQQQQQQQADSSVQSYGNSFTDLPASPGVGLAVGPGEPIVVALTLNMDLGKVSDVESFKRDVSADVSRALGPVILRRLLCINFYERHASLRTHEREGVRPPSDSPQDCLENRCSSRASKGSPALYPYSCYM